MKKLVFFYCILLSMTGCDLLSQPEEIETFKVVAFCNNEEYGFVSPSDTTVRKGGTAEVRIITLPGYVVEEVKVNGEIVHLGNENILYVYNIDSNTEISVIFKKVIEYATIVATAGIGGTISPSGLNTIEKGEDLPINIVASQGYWIDSIYFDGVGQKVPRFTSEYYYLYKAEDTLHHEFRPTFVAKKTYTVIVRVDTLTTCSHIGSFTVVEGQAFKIDWSSKQFCSSKSQTLDGVAITGSSYTWNKIDADHVLVLSSQKEPEWYLVNIKWKMSYVNIGGTQYETIDEVLDFLPDGAIKLYYNGKDDGYTFRKWTKNNGVITFKYGGIYEIATVDECDDDVMIFHYVDSYGGTIIQGYSNIGYQ